MRGVSCSDISAMSARPLRCLLALLGVLALSLAAGATRAGASGTSPSSTVTGPITALGSSWFTVQTSGRRVGVINALTAAATTITNENTPYVWGGGHAEAGVPSVGAKGSGSTRARKGFDCSGAVTAVLAGAGLWPAGAGVPADNGVISELLSEHLIARGVASAPDGVTLYDDPGVHIFMNIDGRFFGTSDGAGGGDAAGGAGWLADGAWDASSRAYRKYHLLPTVLAQKTSYGNDFTFQLPTGGLFAATRGSAQGLSLGELRVADLLAGERVQVNYSTNGTGAMVVSSVAVISGGPAVTAPTTSTTTTPTSPTPTTPTTTTPVPSGPSAAPVPTGTPTPITTVGTPATPVPATTTPAPSATVTVSTATASGSGSGSGGAGYTGGVSATGGSALG